MSDKDTPRHVKARQEGSTDAKDYLSPVFDGIERSKEDMLKLMESLQAVQAITAMLNGTYTCYELATLVGEKKEALQHAEKLIGEMSVAMVIPKINILLLPGHEYHGWLLMEQPNDKRVPVGNLKRLVPLLRA